MKKTILSLVVLLGVVLSGCGLMNDESTKTSPDSSEHKNEKSETSSTPKDSTPSETSMASENVNGVWLARGKEDRVSSTWYFNNGQLIVNYVNEFSYDVAENKDSNGYTVVTIINNEGKEHALLLKEKDHNFEGITAENEAYDKYLADETVPAGKIIEFSFQKNVWGSMDEAIDFWENTYKNDENEVSNDIIWGNYRRDLWSLVKEGTSSNKITLHFTNISGAGGSYVQMIKKDKNTEITDFDGNASYPNNPSMKYTVQNTDYKVIKTEEL